MGIHIYFKQELFGKMAHFYNMEIKSTAYISGEKNNNIHPASSKICHFLAAVLYQLN